MKILCFNHVLIALLIILQFSNYINPSLACKGFGSKKEIEYIKTSCRVTSYPKLCNSSLLIYARKIKTKPKLMAEAALNVSLKATKETLVIMNRLSKIHRVKPIVTEATLDCVEEISDAVDELRQCIKEMINISRGNSKFGVLINDIQTWASAALTYEDTCMDGFDGNIMKGKVKNIVQKYILKVDHLTSNALALVNTYASAKEA